MNDEPKGNDSAKQAINGNDTARENNSDNIPAGEINSGNVAARENDKSARKPLSGEIIVIVTGFVAVIGVLITLFIFIDLKFSELRIELKTDMNAGVTRIENRLNSMDNRLNSIDGRIDGLYQRAEERDEKRDDEIRELELGLTAVEKSQAVVNPN